jgi:hypothetical protein
MRVHYAILAALALVAGAAEAATRTWTSANGKFTIEAEMVTVKDEKVQLRKANGDLIEVPLDKLSEADRQYANTSCAREDDGKTAAPSAAAADEAATCTLELKRLGASKGAVGAPAGDSFARWCSPQTFFMDVGGRGRFSGGDADAFRQVVKREPRSYVAARPFRGVARLGSREYGFVLDASSPAVPGYDRLYFDLNGNGDLTDDRVIAGVISGTPQVNTAAFPRVDLPIEVDGSRQDYSFYFKSLCSSVGGYATASLTPAVYREGKLQLGSKKCHVVLLDANSNGRFSDESHVPSMTGVPQIIPGDTLLFSIERSGRTSRGGGVEGRCCVAKEICVDGRFYQCQIPPLGDKLTLKPSAAELGYVTNPNPGFNAVIYNDAGTVLTINGGKTQIALPEGSWRLVSYTMDQFALTKSGAATKSTRGKRRSSAAPAVVGVGGRGLILLAAATADSPVIHVRKDSVEPFPFGPPYKAVILSNKDRSQTNTVRLSLLLTGAGGERCTSIMLANGSRPTPPAFTIVNAAGKVVEQGKFEFG